MPTSSPKFTGAPSSKASAGDGITMPDTSDVAAEIILIHVLEDGFTAHGRVWYRGQELEYETESRPYRDTLDKAGNSWLLMDDAAQMRAYGRVMFRPGPWPGEPYADEKAASEEQKRRRIPPTLTPVIAGRR